MKPQSPCKDCKEREVGCHAECERFAAFRMVLDEWKQTISAKKDEGAEASQFRRETFAKVQKMRGKKI